MAFTALALTFVVVLVFSPAHAQVQNKMKDKAPPISIKKITVAEYDVFTVSCTYPQRIVVTSASYGMGSKRADVTSRVSDFCESSSFCRFLVNNNHPFDQDPYPGVKKELKVKYYCYGPMKRNPGQARPSGIAVQEQ
ncbi:hypothetical protein RvY_17297 [Ramazzottius varieornatus]|uniref:SUEL-type lectin domain-containing protein n=1 Tax=Ramazzottius varieornatus TaxID=947166 RepID=A0A1D1W1N6_RAMVA|nr:hypothetical protein RvY_17297 [Ramazzottius varieornatus]